MATVDLSETAKALVADGKGILAADETVPTITRRLAALEIESTPESRRTYREMFFTTPGVSEFISGVILQDETIHQENDKGARLPDLLIGPGIMPGIKVDNGAKPLAGSPGERITEGLDGLRDRLREYRKLGARFAKWRAVIEVSDTMPSGICVLANAYALARYAALCQEEGIVPIVEPEVLMDGPHTIERCEDVTGKVLHVVFDALFEHDVSLEGMLLKPNMVVPGGSCTRQAPVEEVAVATLRCLRRHVPAAVPGVVFLSGGQDPLSATVHLNTINQIEGPKPWKLSFSYGRALQDEALDAWHGHNENLRAGQQAFYHRAKCDSAAALGRYSALVESELAAS
ncbi:MAG: fructose-bisphosphate aldolase class I [Xanthobacteraceae bacterium]|nr:fructose-bisphosphate aldolase class I [Xanthobacteraceae bacterium]